MSRRLNAAQVAALSRGTLAAARDIYAATGGPVQATVLHDDDCRFVVNGECTCTPEIRVEPLTATTVKAAAEGMRAWKRARLS